jgi:hypothetical protein
MNQSVIHTGPNFIFDPGQTRVLPASDGGCIKGMWGVSSDGL